MAFIQKSSESKKSENESNKTKQINKALSFFFFFFFSLVGALASIGRYKKLLLCRDSDYYRCAP